MTQVLLLILGMHRSGTSCLAGSLERAGFYAGEVMGWNADNARGNREHPEVMDINIRLLADNCGNWRNPPADGIVAVSDTLRQRRDSLVASLTASGQPGMFKDPRTLLTLRFWLEANPSPRRLGIFRHPLSVALSLLLRDGIPLHEGLKLWLAYNDALLAEYRRSPFPMVCFDVDADVFLRAVASALQQECGDLITQRRIDPDLVYGFFAEELRHHRRTGESLRQEDVAPAVAAGLAAALSLYEQLIAIAGCGDATAASWVSVPRFVIALTAAGEAAANGQWDEALSCYRAAAVASPDPGAIWRHLISLLRESGRRDMLRALCSEAVAACPGDLWLSLQLATTFFVDGCVADALSELDRAAAMSPTADRPWIARGDFMLATGYLDEAVAAYRQAIAICPPGDYRAHAGLGEALIDAQQRRAGDESFRIALTREPVSLRPGVMRRWAAAIRRNANQGNGV